MHEWKSVKIWFAERVWERLMKTISNVFLIKENFKLAKFCVNTLKLSCFKKPEIKTMMLCLLFCG